MAVEDDPAPHCRFCLRDDCPALRKSSAVGAVIALLRTVGFVVNLHPQRIEEHDGIRALKRPALPRRHFRNDPVGHGTNQVGGDLHGLHLREKGLNLAHGHAPRVQCESLVVEARKAALVFRNQPRRERPLAIAWHIDPERAVIGEHGFAARPIPVIRRVVCASC
jgi:hypothetical protein